MKKISQLSKRDQYLEKIYGEWYNLVAAGTFFIIYALIAICYEFILKDNTTVLFILERFPGFVLIVMGCFFSVNAIRRRSKYDIKSNVLLARGIFDILSGIFIVFLPALGGMTAMLVMGLALIFIGVRFLVSLNSNVLDYILSIIFIPVGLSDIDVTNFLVPYDLRVLIFALFLGCLGIFLIYISKSYREATKNLY